MVYVPIDFMARFVGTTITEQALDRKFGSREAWESVRTQQQPRAETSRLLAEAYADALRGEAAGALVSQFVVDPVSRNRYYLFFGTDHIDGLKAMKAAYWKVDPEDGRGYRQDVLEAGGQVCLSSQQSRRRVSPSRTSHRFYAPVLATTNSRSRRLNSSPWPRPDFGRLTCGPRCSRLSTLPAN